MNYVYAIGAVTWLIAGIIAVYIGVMWGLGWVDVNRCVMAKNRGVTLAECAPAVPVVQGNRAQGVRR